MRSQAEGLAATHASLVAGVAGLADDQMREPTLLPEWSRDLLMAHLHFAGQGALRCAQAAARGETVVMYSGGDDQRSSEIQSRRGWSARALVDEVAATCAALDGALAALPEQAWQVPMTTRRGPVPMQEVLVQRWIDVETHHVDLDIGYSFDDWPVAVVDAGLHDWMHVMPALHQRPDSDTTLTAAWRLVRTDGNGDWTLHVDAERAWITVDRELDAPCTFRGPGHDLFALVLGRASGPQLSIDGDEVVAAAFKAAFPGP